MVIRLIFLALHIYISVHAKVPGQELWLLYQRPAEDFHRAMTSWSTLPKEYTLFLHVISKDDTLILEAKTLDLGSVSFNALMLKQWLECFDEMQYRNVKQYSPKFHIFIFIFTTLCLLVKSCWDR